MFNQAISIVGAVIVLGAYLGLQRDWLRAHSRMYNGLNFVGAVLLLWVALADQQAGFIIVEGSWALLSVPGMIKSKGKKD